MFRLYTINGRSPGGTYDFTVDGELFGGKPLQHTHTETRSGVLNVLNIMFNAKADVTHTHDYVDSLVTPSGSAAGNVVLSLTGLAGSVSGSTLTLSYTPQSGGVCGGLRNVNTGSARSDIGIASAPAEVPQFPQHILVMEETA